MADLQAISLKSKDKVVAYVLGFLGLALLGGIGYSLFLLMPLLVDLAKNTIIFFAELVVLALMGLTVVNVWNERDLFIYKWKNYVRNVRKAIIADDPIGVLSTAIRRFQDKLELIDERMAEAEGARKTQLNGIRNAEAEADKALNLFKAAKNAGKTEREQAVYAVSSERWKAAAAKMQPMADLMKNMMLSLQSARELASTTLTDLENQLRVTRVELETAKAGRTAVKSLKAFFGKTDDSDMAEMAFDEIERQTNEAEAEIEQFMRVIDPAIKSQDLSKQAEATAAMNRLNGVILQKGLPPATDAEVLSITSIKQSVPVRR